MAGGVLKTFGVLFLIVGVLALIAGLIAAGYGAMDQQDHQEDAGPLGVGEDDDRTEANEALIMGGAATAGLGFFGVVLGIILVVAGGVRADNALRRQMQQQQVVVSTDGTSDGTRVVTQQQQDGPPKKGLAAAGVVAALLVVAVLVIASTSGGPLGGERLLGGPEPAHIRDDEQEGRTGPGFSLLGNDPAGAAWSTELVTPGATQRLEARLNWTPVTGGPASYQLIVYAAAGDDWTQIASSEVASDDVLSIDATGVGGLEGRSLRIDVQPGGTGPVAAQDFTLRVSYYRR